LADVLLQSAHTVVRIRHQLADVLLQSAHTVVRRRRQQNVCFFHAVDMKKSISVTLENPLRSLMC